MSEEIAGRIQREMSEIRSRMEPDVTDLRKHIGSQVVTERAERTIRRRLRQAADRGTANLKAKQRGFADSAKSSISLARRKFPGGRGQ